jgi:hypothetical protein
LNFGFIAVPFRHGTVTGSAGASNYTAEARGVDHGVGDASATISKFVSA